MMKKLFLYLICILPLSAMSQDSVAYSRDFEFKEGFFLTLEQFKNNDPILKSAVISSYPQTEVDFISQVINSKYITYKNKDGKEQKVETLSLWGYCQNRTICINFNKEFNRVNVIGTLFLFSATVNTPIGYRDPMNVNYGINYVDELRQFVLDTHTNKIEDFNVKNMELLLQENDPELYTEFMALKKSKKNDSIFIYLRKLNEKHPLYLSAN